MVILVESVCEWSVLRFEMSLERMEDINYTELIERWIVQRINRI